VLLRDRPDGGCETLLTRRHDKSKFAAGDFVFPGGKIEAADAPDDPARWCAGITPDDAARRLGLADPGRALACWVAAIREVFEEVGVLLARPAGGGRLGIAPPRLAEHRRACQRDHRTFWEMLRAEGLVLATDRLVYFAHWVTPEERPLRFDTRFFAAPMPEGQEAEADAHEITEVRWLTPAEALAARARGEISLRLPTMRNLGLIAGAVSTAEALAALHGREIAMIRPRLVTEGGTQRALLPGDPGWF
jgi:8-oxo-dGTP pyrophosphatase MutT (NUDIX family)